MNQKNKGLLAAHISVILFGGTGIFGKFVVLSPFLIVLGRMFFASLFVGGVLLAVRENIKLHSKKDIGMMFLLGILWAANVVLFYQSVQVSTVAIGVLSFSTFPIFTTFLEPLFSKEKLKPVNVLVALVTMIGIALVVPKYEFNDSSLQGILWGLGSGFSISLLSILNGKYMSHYTSLTSAFYQNIIATVVLLPFLFLLQPILDIQTLGLLIILGVVFSALPHILMLQGLARLPARVVSIILSLESVYGILFAIVFLSEIPTVRVVIGGIVIIAASIYATLATQNTNK